MKKEPLPGPLRFGCAGVLLPLAGRAGELAAEREAVARRGAVSPSARRVTREAADAGVCTKVSEPR